MSKKLLHTLLIVASFVLYYIGINPLYTGVGGIVQIDQSIQSLQVLNTQYDDTLSQADNLFNQAETLRTQYSQVSSDDKAKMAIMVPNSIDKVRLLSEVRGIGEDAGFSLANLSFLDSGTAVPPAGTTGPSKGVVTVSFSVKTTYPRFKVLMSNFEKSMRLFSVDSIIFSTPQKEGDLIAFDVRLKTYYLK